jgi:hypothetical protein
LPLPTPTYSLTDVGTALGTVLVVILDILAGAGVIPILDPVTRGLLMSSLTVLAVFGISAYTANRRVKHQTQAQVAAAGAVPQLPTKPEPPPLSTGGTFVLTPVSPGPSETHPAPKA